MPPEQPKQNPQFPNILADRRFRPIKIDDITQSTEKLATDYFGQISLHTLIHLLRAMSQCPVAIHSEVEYLIHAYCHGFDIQVTQAIREQCQKIEEERLAHTESKESSE